MVSCGLARNKDELFYFLVCNVRERPIEPITKPRQKKKEKENLIR